MRYFPLYIDFQDKTILISGGGELAIARLRLLLKSEARIRLVSDVIAPEIIKLAWGQNVELIERALEPGDWHGVSYLFAASGDPASDKQVTELARARGIPVNAIDQPEQCDFLMPAIVDRDPVVVAIGTEGKAPLLARDIRAKIEMELPSRLGALAQFAGSWRKATANTLPRAKRLRFWRQFLSGLSGQKMLAGQIDQARIAAMTLLASHSRNEFQQKTLGYGPVCLVGAGPGDPELLTLKAHRLLQEADVIVHDRLVSKVILDGARRDARFIDVGKIPFTKSGRKSIQQTEINKILIREARAGNNVVRLKGGDPFIFGRGGEELAALQHAGIEAKIVPGISAALACAASANLPLTDRRANRSLTLMTGAATYGNAEHDWADLVHRNEPFAAYMAVGAAAHMESQLGQAGLHPATPAVIVENGTLPNERIVATTIAKLSATVSAKAIKGPAIIYVGLSWEDCDIQRPTHVEVYDGHGQPLSYMPPPAISDQILNFGSSK